jgi:hypothetical protein
MRLTRMRASVGITLAAALALAAPSALAAGAGSGSYTLVITPSSVSGAVSTSFTVAITDDASSTLRLGALDLAAPAGFQLTSASLPPTSPGTASVSGSVVQFRTLRLAPGQTVDATVVATPPCTAPTYLWSSTGYNEWNASGPVLAFDDAASQTAGTVSSPCSLAWTTEPTDTVVSQVISGTALDPAGPPLQVELLDGNGNSLATSGVPVTVSIDNNPSGGTLSGTTTVDTSGGVASFGDLSIDTAGDGYTLEASTPSNGSGTSTAFNVVTSGATCPPGQTCQTTTTTNDSILTVAGSGNVTISTDVGSPLTCPGYTAQDGHWFSFLSSSGAGKLVTYELMPTTAQKEAVGGTHFCFGATYDFPTSAGTPAPAGTLPDGTSGYIGLLPVCAGTPTTPCISGRTKTPDPSSPAGYDVTFQVTVPAGLPGDPWGRM